MVYQHSSVWTLTGGEFGGQSPTLQILSLHELHPLWVPATCFAPALHAKFPWAQAEAPSEDKRDFYSTEGQEIQNEHLTQNSQHYQHLTFT